MVSSIIGNVQNVYIQKGVNEANKKLNEVIRTQAHMVGQLNVITGLQIVNLAASLINVGVSLKYLPKIEQQVTEMNVLVKELSNHIEKQEKYEYIEKYNKYSFYMIDLLENLEYDASNININSFSDIEAFLIDIITKFNNHDIDGTIGCNVIFGLVPAYVQAVKMYSANWYYNKSEHDGKLPNVYKRCLKILESLDSDTFRETMKRHLLINYSEIHIEDMYKGFHSINTSIENSINNFLFEPEIWKALPQKDYENLDQIIMDKIKSDDSVIECNDNMVYIPIEV